MSRSVEFAQLYPIVTLICDTLDRLRITYLVCGSVAAYLHGHRARETHDVDLLADVQPRHVSRLSAALNGQFLNADTRILNEALDLARVWREGGQTINRPSINLLYRLVQTLHVDIFLPIGAERNREWRWEQAQFKNRVRERMLNQRQVWIASVADTLIAKLRWYAWGHGVSDQQWSDLQTLLHQHRQQLNRPYLDYWAAEFGLADLWDAVWRNQRPPPPDEEPTQLTLF
jgi:hypothetical protein